MLPTARPSSSLFNRAELGIAHYLHHTVGLQGLALSLGTMDLGPQDPPRLLIAATASTLHPDLPGSAGTYTLALTLSLDIPPGDRATLPASLLQRLACIQVSLADLSALQSFLNLPASGLDSRPIGGFHLLDLIPAPSSPTAPAGRYHRESLGYLLTCVPADTGALATPATVATYYRRPGGADLYRAPNGTDLYLRP